MKKILMISLFLIFLIPNLMAQEKDILSGQVMFTCDLRSDIMEKGGFNLLKKTTENGFKVSYFGANEAKIIVKNSDNKIVGIGKAIENGTYSISVKSDSFYIIEISFLSHKVEETLSSDDSKNRDFFIGKIHSKEMLKFLGL